MAITHKYRSSAAFTIVELLVVIVVIGILAAITIVSYTGISQRAIISSLQSDLVNASQQLKLYQVDNSSYPNSITDCPTPAAGNMCIIASAGTSYMYQVNNTSNNKIFCIAATKNSQLYKITQDDKPSIGGCIITSNLALHLDATSPASYSGAGTNWNDISGNGHNGTFASGISYDSSNGGALTFDGSGFVSLPNFLNQTPANQEWTAIAMVKLVSTTPTGNLQQLINFDSGINFVQPNTNRLLLYLNGGTDDYYDYGNFNLRDNLWHMVSFVFQNSTGKKVLYVDGVDVSIVGPNNTSTPSGLPGTLNIGVGTIGKISDVSIYNRALSTSEIQQNFNSLRGRYGL